MGRSVPTMLVGAHEHSQQGGGHAPFLLMLTLSAVGLVLPWTQQEPQSWGWGGSGDTGRVTPFTLHQSQLLGRCDEDRYS